MKNLLFVAFFSFFAFVSKAQIINANQNATTQTVKETTVYCDVICHEMLNSFTNKVWIEVDFGQSQKLISGINYNILKDKDGEAIVFKSIIDALNFMSNEGWSLVNTFTEAIPDVKNTNIHYIMKKTVVRGN